MITVQGRGTGRHRWRKYWVHLFNGKRLICRGHIPQNLRRVNKKPTCKHCIVYEKRHQEFLEYARPLPDGGPMAFHVWDFPVDFLVHFDDDARLRYLAELAYQRLNHTSFYYALKASSHKQGKRSNQPAAYRIWRAKQLAKKLGIPLSRMEVDVSVVFQGKRPNGLTGPYPKEPTTDWAWLAGLWFGCGRHNVRDRVCPPSEGHNNGYRSWERTAIFHVEYGVRDELVRLGQRIGCPPVVSTYRQYKNTHFAKVNVFFPGVVYYILRKFGLPPMVPAKDVKGMVPMGAGRRRTSREVHLHVPEFVKATPELSRAFVEGYLNSSKFQAWHKVVPNRSKTGDWHVRGCFVTAYAPKEAQVIEFISFLGTVIARAGVSARPYKMTRFGKNHAWKLELGRANDNLLRYFHIYKENAASLIR